VAIDCDGFQVTVFPAANTSAAGTRLETSEVVEALGAVVTRSAGSVLIRAVRPVERDIVVSVQLRRNRDGATGPPHWLALTCRRQLDVLCDWLQPGGPLLEAARCG